MQDSSMIYEVNLTLDSGIVTEFREWLGLHIDDMLRIDGFESAEVLLIEEPEPSPGKVALSVRYLLRDRAALNQYLATHAAQMRAEGINRFGEQFSATRRVLSAHRL